MIIPLNIEPAKSILRLCKILCPMVDGYDMIAANFALKSQRIFYLKSIIRSLILMSVTFISGIGYAEPPKIEISGGISTPAPGVAGHTVVCWRVWRLGCAGVSLLGTRNEVTSDNMTSNASYVTGSLEQGFALSDDYHFIWVNGVAGGSYYRRKSSDSSRPEDESWQKFAPSYGAGFGLELPIADLIGVRFGFQMRKALLTGASTHVALTAGVRFGSEWLGFGQ